jgi:hypothetical protein
MEACVSVKGTKAVIGSIGPRVKTASKKLDVNPKRYALSAPYVFFGITKN